MGLARGAPHFRVPFASTVCYPFPHQRGQACRQRFYSNPSVTRKGRGKKFPLDRPGLPVKSHVPEEVFQLGRQNEVIPDRLQVVLPQALGDPVHHL